MGKIGDVYRIGTLTSNRFFQFVASDDTQLGGDVIAVLKFRGDIPVKATKEDIQNILASGAEFFTHTMLNAGTQANLWSRIGRADPIDFSGAQFKDVRYKDILPDIEPYEADHYDNWVLWSVGGLREEIGSNIEEYPHAELGAVFDPENVIYRIENGKYPGVPYYGQEK